MKKNVGNIDRTIRIIAGILLLLAGTFMQMQVGWRIGLFAVAAIAFVTAFVNFWPLWAVLGISTVKGKKEEKAAGPKEEVVEKPEEKGKPAGQ